VWAPLASGVLTDAGIKGNSDNLTKKDTSRHELAKERNEWLEHHTEKWRKQGKLDNLKKLNEWVKSKFNCTLPQFALAWCVKNKYVTSVLLGAVDPDELKENFKAIDIAEKLEMEDMCKVDEILGNKPAPYFGYGDYTNKRRSICTLEGFRSTNQQESDCRKK
jgi:aryl-alcohol dehydrogenase-like predicted oxidoreductase